MTLQAGNNQTATVGAPVPVEPSVILKDESGRAVPGVAVAWAVASGGGSVSSATSTTGADGVAFVTWTLGQLAGANTVTATVSGLTGSPVTFSATGVAGPPAAARSALRVSSATVASGAADTLTLQARDAFGNAIATGGATVVFSAGGGTSTGTIGATTDHANGTYTATFTGVIAGSATTIGATINSAAVTTAPPTVIVTAGSAARLAIATQPSSSAQSGVAFGQQPAVQLQDASGNAASQSGVVVTASIATGGASLGGTTTATTNAAGVATFADLQISGVVGARTLGFAATGLTGTTSNTITVTAGAAAQLALSAGNDQSAPWEPPSRRRRRPGDGCARQSRQRLQRDVRVATGGGSATGTAAHHRRERHRDRRQLDARHRRERPRPSARRSAASPARRSPSPRRARRARSRPASPP